MTVEEIFMQIANHMIEGLMFHSQMSEYYEFLGLPGYSECHKYHYFCESWSFQDLCLYYIDEYNKLLPVSQASDPGVIPSSWYKYIRQDVDMNTRRSSIKTGLERWVEWETETKTLYEKMYKELINLGEVAAACKIQELVEDVSKELKTAQQYHLNKKASDYDMSVIVEEQSKHKEMFEVKTRGSFMYR